MGIVMSKPPHSSLRLVQPQAEYESQIMAARDILRTHGGDDGTADLVHCDTYDAWLDFDGRGKAIYGDGYVPSTQYIGVLDDGTVVGFLDLRHTLSDFLYNYGGHIGYCVLPQYRRHGYAKAMLALALTEARQRGMDRLLLTCHEGNTGSERTIVANGGVYEDTRTAQGASIRRFWIEL